jgi:Uma2 family endonuclease
MLVRERMIDVLTRAGDDSRLEVHRGQLREKPLMSFDHGDVMTYLAVQLVGQVDRKAFRVHVNNGRVRRTESTYYIPDIIVIPMHLTDPFRGKIGVLEIYDDPLPLVVEVWSESTGDYDVDEKLPEYIARGDREILRLHPYERTLTSWRRQPDGTYTKTVFHGGKVELHALPGVVIDLDELYELIPR